MTTLSINFHQEQAKMQETFEIHGMVYEFSMDHLADVVALGKELCRWPIHHICEEVDQKPVILAICHMHEHMAVWHLAPKLDKRIGRMCLSVIVPSHGLRQIEIAGICVAVIVGTKIRQKFHYPMYRLYSLFFSFLLIMVPFSWSE